MQRTCAYLFLTAMVFAVFAQIAGHEFLNFDDQLVVTDNPRVREGLTTASLSWAWTTGHFANWMPFTWMSHQLDAELFGDWAGGHHVSSLILHWLGVILFFDALWVMTGQFAPSLMVAALYAVHPLHVESVAWISERKGILSTFFWMLSLRLYASFAHGPTVLAMAMVTMAMIAGLLAKQMLVTLPLALLLLDLWPLARWDGSARCFTLLAAEKIPLFVAAIAFSIIAYMVQAGGEAVASLDELPLRYRFANAAVAIVVYLRRVFWPNDLSIFYPHPLEKLSDLVVAGSSALVVGLTVAAIVARRKYPFLTVGWLWYLITLVPVLGFVQVGSHGMADRYADIPLIGIYVALVWSMKAAADRFAAPVALQWTITGLILAVVAASGFLQTTYWRNSRTLFEGVLAVDPDNYMAFNQLGALAEEKGDLEEARRLYLRSIEEHDGFRIAHANFARVLLKLGETRSGLLQLAVAADLGDQDAALQLRHHAVAMDSRDTEAWGLQGQLLFDAGRYRQAAVLLRRAARQAPDSAIAHQRLGAALYRLADWDGARDAFVRACLLDRVILKQIEEAGETSDRTHPVLLDIIAACQSNVDSMDKAIATMDRAIALAKQERFHPILPSLERRRKQYQSNTPYTPNEN